MTDAELWALQQERLKAEQLELKAKWIAQQNRIQQQQFKDDAEQQEAQDILNNIKSQMDANQAFANSRNPNNGTVNLTEIQSQEDTKLKELKNQKTVFLNAAGYNLDFDAFNKLTANQSGDLHFRIPQYGVQDFINERALWQKGVHNITGEPGWFYFKVFFHFNEPRGLFAGILNNDIPNTCALRYLFGIRDYYTYDKIYDRMLALCRFTYTLSYINSVSPWFFIGLNNLSQLNDVNITELGKEKSIDLICNGEAVDMRINTLLDMYKYACYDDINMKEILPENLRKFDMSIIIMNVPIKYFQTGMMISGQDSTMSQVGKNGDTFLNKAISGMNKITGFLNGSDTQTFNYKSIMGRNNTFEDSLSFQMFTLKNCEIDPISFSNYLPSSMNNSDFTKLNNTAIKIKYDRVYKNTFNEWQQMMYGSTGIYYDGTIENIINKGNLTSVIDTKKSNYEDKNILNAQENRIKAIQSSVYNNFFNKDTDAYKALIDFSETLIEDSLINTDDPTFLGNIGINYNANDYGDMWEKTKDNVKNFFKF